MTSLLWLLIGVILSLCLWLLPSPKLRMSFITYSTYGQTLLKLTSDK